jgi:hypothetical protein
MRRLAPAMRGGQLRQLSVETGNALLFSTQGIELHVRGGGGGGRGVEGGGEGVYECIWNGGVLRQCGGELSQAEAVHPLHGDDEVVLVGGVSAF